MILSVIKNQFVRVVRLLSDLWNAVLNKRDTLSGEAIICMIDIANYSQWCKRYRSSPEHIYRVMYDYNEHICTYLRSYDNLRKIEMVGDSIVVIGMIDDLHHSQKVYIKMLAFASDVLSHVPRMRVDFGDESISVRIGMHVGSIYGGYIRHPRRFQIFGNPINVASRLQSKTEDGSVLITDKSVHRALIKRCYSSSEDDDQRSSDETIPDTEWYSTLAFQGRLARRMHELDDSSYDHVNHNISKITRTGFGCETLKGVGDYTVSRLSSSDMGAFRHVPDCNSRGRHD